MQALDIVLEELNKNIAEKVSEKKRRGPKKAKQINNIVNKEYQVLE